MYTCTIHRQRCNVAVADLGIHCPLFIGEVTPKNANAMSEAKTRSNKRKNKKVKKNEVHNPQVLYRTRHAYATARMGTRSSELSSYTVVLIL